MSSSYHTVKVVTFSSALRLDDNALGWKPATSVVIWNKADLTAAQVRPDKPSRTLNDWLAATTSVPEASALKINVNWA